ncbi:MAG: hypothetical protein MUF15_15150, partial [Acidobacteria bacterium]|nr:hypothetical protein [Acidobacteriota bacterium]
MNKLPELIFNKSRNGKIGYSFSDAEFSDDLIAVDNQYRREEESLENFPQLSEVEIVRHYTNLSHLNHSVDSGFYPLGSCTMKYNPKINEAIAGWEEFSAHPYTPLKFIQGNLEIMKTLEKWADAGLVPWAESGMRMIFRGLPLEARYERI